MIAAIDHWVPPVYRNTVRALALEIDDTIRGFVRGQSSLCLVLAAFYALALSPRGTLLVSAGWDRSIRLWDYKKATQIAIIEDHDEDVWGITFSPDGKRIASAGQDKTVKVWDVDSGKKIATYNASGVLHTVRFSPDGKQIAAAGRAGTIQIWNAP